MLVLFPRLGSKAPSQTIYTYVEACHNDLSSTDHDSMGYTSSFFLVYVS